MTYTEERQDQIDQAIAEETAGRDIANCWRWFGNTRCLECGDVEDGMRWIDVDYLVQVLSIYTLGQLRRYLLETASEGTKWYRRIGDSEIVLYYPCLRCGPAEPPKDKYRRMRIPDEKGDLAQPDKQIGESPVPGPGQPKGAGN